MMLKPISTLSVAEIVKMPELPQAKVNKCMIALVAAKQVTKQSSDQGIVYRLSR
jgi:DASH complex subunit DAM1